MTDPLRRTGPWVTSVGAALATIITLCTPTSPARADVRSSPPAAAAARAVVRTLDGHLMALGRSREGWQSGCRCQPRRGGRERPECTGPRRHLRHSAEAGWARRVAARPRVFLVDGVGRGTARGVAVSITYTSSTAPSAGARRRDRQPSGAHRIGYVTTASRIALGRALATSDAASLFTHVAALRVSAAPLVQPLFPMVTLTLRGINAQGGPLDGGADAAYVQVVNVDDARRYSGFATFVRGQARVSVPVGHYHVDTVSVNRLKPTELRSVLQPEVVVSTAMTLTTDARTATVPVRISADVATVPELTGTAYGRYDATGAGAASGVLVVPPGVAALSAPTAPVTIGTLRVLALARLAAPTVVRNRYGFEVVRELGGVIPPSMTLTVRRAEMVTENDLYYSPSRAGGMSTRTTWLGDFAVSWGGWVQSQSRLTTI